MVIWSFYIRTSVQIIPDLRKKEGHENRKGQFYFLVFSTQNFLISTEHQWYTGSMDDEYDDRKREQAETGVSPDHAARQKIKMMQGHMNILEDALDTAWAERNVFEHLFRTAIQQRNDVKIERARYQSALESIAIGVDWVWMARKARAALDGAE